MKKKVSQKISRAPAQRIAAQKAKSTDAREARIASHNGWPVITKTKAETDFSDLLDANPGLQVLIPYPFDGIDDNDFHRHLGMLIDGLEMLPKRPDHAFDFFFRAVDELSQMMTGKTKITDAVESLGPRVCGSLATHDAWKSFINLFSGKLPTPTARFMAQRVLDAYGVKKDPIRPRAERLFGEQRYKDFHQRFRGRFAVEDSKGLAGGANNAGVFLKHLVSQRAARPVGSGDQSYPTLDLADPSNIFDEPKALSAMMSLAAFTSRNERFHGSSLSPFRSSKASLSTYAGYYFEMLFVYTLAVGLMIELFDGCGDVDAWMINMNENIVKLDKLFGKWIK